MNVFRPMTKTWTCSAMPCTWQALIPFMRKRQGGRSPGVGPLPEGATCKGLARSRRLDRLDVRPIFFDKLYREIDDIFNQ